ncbi:MAG: hypothetical protein LH679_08120, partial [Cyanobacteria bacterium CAN_BIN43]|nr:hypothetical protein [Cyanobacteria bacterium CAN_BIN43]
TLVSLMFPSINLSSQVGSSPNATFLEKLRFLIPKVISSIARSMIISVSMTMIIYSLSTAFGLPIAPFFLIWV